MSTIVNFRRPDSDTITIKLLDLKGGGVAFEPVSDNANNYQTYVQGFNMKKVTKGLASSIALTTLGLIVAQCFTYSASAQGYGWGVSANRAKALYAEALRRSPGACMRAASGRQSGRLISALPRGNNEYVVCDFTNESFATDFAGNKGMYINNRFQRFR
jgi:hypothetical protein